MPVRCVRVFGSPVQGEELYGTQIVSWASPRGKAWIPLKKINPHKKALLKSVDIGKQAGTQ